ncbi:MAG: polysaccharide biosynthesis/export family protein [Dysgonamonadaceae bacterium]|jgi:polysaccharide export outer membrane protein|nr:polysaccharide biosynthesis/export family protein [Dysgonamonadaceae bacterium]
MRKLNIKVIPCVLLFAVTSCTSYKHIPYFQSKGNLVEFEIPASHTEESIVRFQPDDVLAITVNVVGEQKIALDYNLPIQPSATSFDGDDGAIDQQGVGRQTYLVSKNGEIDFPTLGAIKVSGYTQEELQEYIKKLLLGRMKVNPVVTVRLMNFKIMILGEVARPGQYTVNKTHIDLFEAITLAGDMTIYGQRNNVWIRRQLPDGIFKYAKLDLSKANVITSPYFYLRQNDLIYVQPNNMKVIQSDTSLWNTIVGMASFLMTVITFLAVNRR